MTHSSSNTFSTAIESQLRALLWSLWAELGVSGWTRRHQEWEVDPEPTLIFTSLFGDADPRLRDEALDWSLKFGRYVSASRLKNLVRAWGLEQDERWGEFSATVNALGPVVWPAATTPLPFDPTGRTSLEDFTRPALLSLRLRARFGVGARAEIFRYFVTHPSAPLTAADVADFAQFTKRNVEKELEGLRVAGVLTATLRRNRLEHRLSDPAELLVFAGSLPRHYPRWDAIFPVLRSAWEAARRSEGQTPLLATIELRRAIEPHEREIATASLPPLPESSGPSSEDLRDWCLALITALAKADAGTLGWAARVPQAPPQRPVLGRMRIEGARSPLLVEAADLTEWAKRRDAQERLPQLIRRLILSTVEGVDRIHFPSGESVQLGGWDGELHTSVGNTFVPQGLSVWEMGVNRDVKGKAESDYRKRTDIQDGQVERSTTVFVFVTPRRWAGKQSWAREKTREGTWREVRAYDADDLETWLELSPSTHVWLSGLLGKSTAGVRGLETFWESWRTATQPELSADLVTAGRETVADALRQRLRGDPTTATIQAPSQEEVLAFIAAAYERGDSSERDGLFARTLVVEDSSAWSWASQVERPLILVPLFENPELVLAFRGAHHVLVPTGPESPAKADIQIPRIRWERAREVLVQAGEDWRRAETLAGLARNSLTSLRRQLAVSSLLRTPLWAQQQNGTELIPALLAGGWNGDVERDREVMERLAGQEHAAIERQLTHWTQSPDPPIRRTGTSWRLVSKEDAWLLLSRSLTSADLSRFRQTALELLGSLTSAPPDAGGGFAFDQQKPPSAALREGFADTIAVLGARSGDFVFPDGRTGQEHANAIVRELLSRANGETAGQLWSELSDVLPILAEAAPDEFLAQVATTLAHKEPVLLGLFRDGGDATSAQLLGGPTPHTGLLWALENLAWSSEYLGPAALALARLARMDPGGRLSNRPSNSLRAIFLPWLPQTAASLAVRLEVLDLLRREEPDVAWKLLLTLAPTIHDASSYTHAPRWRDWRPPSAGSLPPDLAEAHTEIARRLVEDVGTSGGRWLALIPLVASSRDDGFRTQLICAIERLQNVQLTPADQLRVWAALRSEISQHQRFPDAAWRMEPSETDRLTTVYARLAPEDPVERHAWLFEASPPLVCEGEPSWAVPADVMQGEEADSTQFRALSEKWQRFEDAVDAEQQQAVQELLASGGLPLVLELARASKEPHLVGRALGRSELGQSDVLLPIWDLFDDQDPRVVRVAQGYLSERAQVEGIEWAEQTWRERAHGWTSLGRARFLTTLPNEPHTWDLAADFGEETEKAYWTAIAPYGVDDVNNAMRAASNYLRFGHPIHAIVMLGGQLGTARVPTSAISEMSELAVAALELALRDPADLKLLGASRAYELGNLFAYLATDAVVDQSRVAKLEWSYLPILEALRRPPRLLHKELARNPSFFVQILSLVYRGDDEEPSSATDKQKSMAQQGFDLLHSWRDGIPGQKSDGSIDTHELDTWVDEARRRLREAHRTAIGDEQIGQILSRSPTGDDDVWPARPVREVIERVATEPLDSGIVVGRLNSRGVTRRGLTDGGDQERALVSQYLGWAHALASRWPRTASVVRKIAESYAAQARREDVRSTLREDSWR